MLREVLSYIETQGSEEAVSQAKAGTRVLGVTYKYSTLSNIPSSASSLDGREAEELVGWDAKTSLRNTVCSCIQEIKDRRGAGCSSSRLKVLGSSSFSEGHRLYFWCVFMSVSAHECVHVHVHMFVYVRV